MSLIGVVHLVWFPLGLATFASFIESYRQHRSGLSHQLIIVFNGFRRRAELDQYHALLAGLDYRSILTPKAVLDIPAYLMAARRCESQYLCFLNSHSIIEDELWLAKMYTQLRLPGVGVVGATGSYESHYSRHLSLTNTASVNPLRQLWRALLRWHRLRRLKPHFPPAPNYHLRTNAFMLERELMLRLKVWPMHDKTDTLKFESGRESMTRQLKGLGLKALVVGRDGLAYEQERWFESRTFRSGEQENLLISDNRTREYMQKSPAERRLLSALTWSRS